MWCSLPVGRNNDTSGDRTEEYRPQIVQGCAPRSITPTCACADQTASRLSLLPPPTTDRHTTTREGFCPEGYSPHVCDIHCRVGRACRPDRTKGCPPSLLDSRIYNNDDSGPPPAIAAAGAGAVRANARSNSGISSEART